MPGANGLRQQTVNKMCPAALTEINPCLSTFRMWKEFQQERPENDMKKLIANFLNDDSGATAIEYGLIAAGIALAILTAINTVSTNINSKLTSINTYLQ